MPTSAISPAVAGSLLPRPPRSMPCGAFPWSGGFTLLELLIVLSIIAIGTALVIPNIRNTDGKAFNVQVRQAEIALNHARRLAIVHSMPRSATFRSVDTAAPAAVAAEAPARPGEKALRWESGDIELAFRASLDEFDQAVERAEVTFFPQGGSTGGILSLRQDRLRARIRIDPITGRIATRHDDEAFQ